MSIVRPGSGKRVALIHPDLGIGGAERLVVDAALELSALGYEVVMYTGYHSVDRCFEETLGEGGKRADWVRVYGSWMPRHVCGRLHALFANLRCLWATVALLLHERNLSIVIVDQVSAPILLLRAFASTGVVFYCHFPDMLLAKHDSVFRRLYRAPLDFFEQATTGMAHKTLVNSLFTADTFARTFCTLYQSGGPQPGILYPAVATNHSPREAEGTAASIRTDGDDKTGLFLSINRFERKKNLSLALRAYASYRQNTVSVPGHKTQLVLAGGYDKRLRENVEYLLELKREARDLGISSEVVFSPSISAEEKADLLARCLCVMYTPENEHFGIVPLEAMAAGKPVLACNSGGPVESIVDGVTGFLCAPVAEEFAAAMQKIGEDPDTAARMGLLARLHVDEKFSRRAFGVQLHHHFAGLGQKHGRATSTSSNGKIYFCMACLLLVAVLVSLVQTR
mmetsp:Transcript_34865/g.56041  ORF Transcript_34865/g.56041 Transcript_34865/m.56041 type:complete len:453 (+) Transcript_34865:87-1445(+)